MKTKISALLIIIALASSTVAYAKPTCIVTGAGDVKCGELLE